MCCSVPQDPSITDRFWSKVFLISMTLSLTVGCSTTTKPIPSTTSIHSALNDTTSIVSATQSGGTSRVSATKIPSTPTTDTLLEKVVWNAQKQQGKMYRWGGTSPVTGFDCSGLTQYAFNQGAGVKIPRTAAAQYEAAQKIAPNQAQKGDLIFFATRGRHIGHVGVYLGDNKFVHAPRQGKPITTSSLDGYWQQHLVGFGRIPGACRPAFS